MPEKYRIEDRWLFQNPALFQKTVLMAVIKSFQFYRRMKPRLCPMEEIRKGRRPDFTSHEHNRLFGMIADYWDAITPQLDLSLEYGLRYPDVEELLRSEIVQGRMTQGDAQILDGILEQDMELFEFAPEVLSNLHKNRLLSVWLHSRAAANLVELAYNQRVIRPLTLDELRSRIAALDADLSDADERIVRASDLLYRQQTRVIPFPTDMPNINTRAGGGFHPGTTTLVAGINGGGKTILAMQWAKHFALQGANVVVVTTEQPPDQLLVRMLCNHLRIGMERFNQSIAESQLTMAERRRSASVTNVIPESVLTEFADPIAQFYQSIWSRLYFLDWSLTPMTVYADFDTEINKLVSAGWDPDVIVFDWIGGGIENLRGENGGKQLDIRLLYKEAIEVLIKHGKRNNRVMIAMAQVDKVKVGPKKKAVVMSDLAECKSMTDNVTNFIGISALRENFNSTSDISSARSSILLKQFLNLDKARMGSGGIVPVEALFRIQAFRDCGSTNKLMTPT